MIMHIFSIGILISSILVISSHNPVIAIVNMIIAFINGVGIMLLLGVDFIGLLYLIVYIGAIAILFLFVIMMLKIKTKKTRKYITRTTPIAIIFTTLYFFLFQFILAKFYKEGLINTIDGRTTKNTEWMLEIKNKSIIESIGEMIYVINDGEWLILISLILLIAMIGSIILSYTNVAKI